MPFFETERWQLFPTGFGTSFLSTPSMHSSRRRPWLHYFRAVMDMLGITETLATLPHSFRLLVDIINEVLLSTASKWCLRRGPIVASGMMWYSLKAVVCA